MQNATMEDVIIFHGIATCAAGIIVGACIISAAKNIVRGMLSILERWPAKPASS